jgi:hypothetical protein
MKWGIKCGKEMETWEQDIRFIGEEAVIDKGRERFSLFNRIMFSLIPVLRRMTKIVHLKFEQSKRIKFNTSCSIGVEIGGEPGVVWGDTSI